MPQARVLYIKVKNKMTVISTQRKHLGIVSEIMKSGILQEGEIKVQQWKKKELISTSTVITVMSIF